MHDIKSLKKFLSSDEKFIAMLIDKFIVEIPKEAKKLQDSVIEKNWEIAKAVSHKMLSSVKIFDAKELILVLQDIEKNSEDHTRQNQVPGLMKEFKSSYVKTLKEIKKLREKLV